MFIKPNIDFRKDKKHLANIQFSKCLIFTLLLGFGELSLVLYSKKFDVDWMRTIIILSMQYILIIIYLFLYKKLYKIVIEKKLKKVAQGKALLIKVLLNKGSLKEASNKRSSKKASRKKSLKKAILKITWDLFELILQWNILIPIIILFPFRDPQNKDIYELWFFGFITAIYLFVSINFRGDFIGVLFNDKRRIIDKICKDSRLVITKNGTILGLLEGLFISAFILIREYTVIYGFLLFRTIVSFKTNTDTTKGEKEHAEYYLMGILASYLFSIGTTFLYIYVVRMMLGIEIVNKLRELIIQG